MTIPSKAKAYLFVALTSVFVVLFYSNHFVRFTDDAKELWLYGVVFLTTLYFVIFSKTSDYRRHFHVLHVLLGLTLLYYLTNSLFVATAVNEALAATGKIMILAGGVALVARWPIEVWKQFFAVQLLLGLIALIAIWILPQNDLPQIILPVGHVSYFSDYLMLLLPPGVFLVITSGSSQKKIFWAITTLVLFVAVMVMARRSTLIGILFGAILIFILLLVVSDARLRAQLFKFIVVIMLSLVPLLAFLYYFRPHNYFYGHVDAYEFSVFERLNFLWDLTQNSNYLENPRYIVLKRCVEAIGQSPLLGWGYGNFRFVYPRFIKLGDPEPVFFTPKNAHWQLHAHNEMVNQLFEGGLVGFVLTAAVMLVFFYYLWRVIKKSNHDQKSLALVVVSGLGMALISMQLNTSSMSPVVRLMLMIYLGLGYSLIRDEIPAKITLPLNSKKYAKLTALFVFFLWGGVSVLAVASSYVIKGATVEFNLMGKTQKHQLALRLAPGSYDVLDQASQINLRLSQNQQALVFLERAYANFPYLPQLHHRLATAYLRLDQSSKAEEVLSQSVAMYDFYRPTQKLLEKVKNKIKNTQDQDLPE